MLTPLPLVSVLDSTVTFVSVIIPDSHLLHIQSDPDLLSPDLPGKTLSLEHPGKSGSDCILYRVVQRLAEIISSVT